MRIQSLRAVVLAALTLVAFGCQSPTSSSAPAASSAKAITALSLTQAANPSLKQDYTAVWNDVSKVFNVGPLLDTTGKVITDLKALKASFTLSSGASAKVGAVAQTSGLTSNDFTNDVVYTVTAQDGSSTSYKVHVVLLSDKDFSAFSLAVGSDSYVGTISTADPYTVAVTVPNGTNVTNLVASFTIPEGATAAIGSTPQTSGTANDFTKSVKYTVTAQDLSTREYTVTVTVLPPETLLISEYFEGTSNNKYLEITNTGTSDLDLTPYTIAALNYKDGVRNTTGDQSLALTGTLAAGASKVFVNSSYTPTTLTAVKALVDAGTATVGTTAVNFNGDDKLALKHSGVVVDRVGDPAVDYSTSYTSGYYAQDVKFTRKAGKAPSATFSLADWHQSGVSGVTGEDLSAGSWVATEASTPTLTRLVLTTNGNWVGAIDQSALSVAVNAGAGTSATTVKVGLDADANIVEWAATKTSTTWTPLVENSTTLDLSSTKYLRISNAAAASTIYAVTLTVIEPKVTWVHLDATNNYDFDGGLASARALFTNGDESTLSLTSTGTAASGAIKPLDSTTTAAPYGLKTLTGVVTGYTTTNLYLQDKDAAICVFITSNGVKSKFLDKGVKLGDKIQITNASTITNYFGLLEVAGFGSSGSAGGTTAPEFTILHASDETTPVYYLNPGEYSLTSDHHLKVVKYSGLITTAPTSTTLTAGVFDSSTTAKFRTTSTFYSSLSVTSASHDYYSPLDVYKVGTTGVNYLLLSLATQIR